jgi:hypothetical protein
MLDQDQPTSSDGTQGGLSMQAIYPASRQHRQTHVWCTPVGIIATHTCSAERTIATLGFAKPWSAH